jgi:glucose uptake protein GlcU
MISTIPLQNAGGVLFIWLIFFLIGLALTYWVYQDAKKNSQNSAFLWAVVVFLAPILGLVLYFLLGRKGARGRGRGSSQI